MRKILLILGCVFVCAFDYGCKESPQVPSREDYEKLKLSGITIPSQYDILRFSKDYRSKIEIITWVIFSTDSFEFPVDIEYCTEYGKDPYASNSELIDFVNKNITYEQSKKYNITLENYLSGFYYSWSNENKEYVCWLLHVKDGFISIIYCYKFPDSHAKETSATVEESPVPLIGNRL